jgi:hypothetical protein
MGSFEKLCDLFELIPSTGQLRWKVTVSPRAIAGSIAGGVNCHGYVKIGINGKIYSAHKIVWAMATGEWPNHLIDHINGNKSDNRMENLRKADVVKNAYNQKIPKNNKSGYKGVYFDSTRVSPKKWKASCSISGKRFTLGHFMTPEEAHNALIKFREEHHGEFANNG